MYSQKCIDNLFINLKVLSKLRPGQKLYTKEELLVLDDGNIYRQMFMRWWYGEDRIKTLNKIQDIIRSAIGCGQNIIHSELIIHIQNSDILDEKNKNNVKFWNLERNKFIQIDNHTLIKMLLSEMKAALEGMKNLRQSYDDDKTLSSKLELECELMQSNIRKFDGFVLSLTTSTTDNKHKNSDHSTKLHHSKHSKAS